EPAQQYCFSRQLQFLDLRPQCVQLAILPRRLLPGLAQDSQRLDDLPLPVFAQFFKLCQALWLVACFASFQPGPTEQQADIGAFCLQLEEGGFDARLGIAGEGEGTEVDGAHEYFFVVAGWCLRRTDKLRRHYDPTSEPYSTA